MTDLMIEDDGALPPQAQLDDLGEGEIRASTYSPDYVKADDLFPLLSQHQGEMECRQYVEDEMIKLAKADKLSVTELHQQSTRAARLAGMIILGQHINPESMLMELHPERVPATLRNYRIKVKSTGDRTIEWKRGMEPKRTVQNRAGMVHMHEGVYMRSKLKEAVVPLVTGWTILHQAGKYCVPGATLSAQAGRWHYEEVPRDQWSPASMPEPPKRKGR
jgi:hypothetical protein